MSSADRDAVFVLVSPAGVVRHFRTLAERAGLQFRVIPVQTGSFSPEATPVAEDRPMSPSPSPLLLRLERVAETLDVSTSSVKRLVQAGALPTVKVGGATRVRVEDFQRYLEGLGQAEEGA